MASLASHLADRTGNAPAQVVLIAGKAGGGPSDAAAFLTRFSKRTYRKYSDMLGAWAFLEPTLGRYERPAESVG